MFGKIIESVAFFCFFEKSLGKIQEKKNIFATFSKKKNEKYKKYNKIKKINKIFHKNKIIKTK